MGLGQKILESLKTCSCEGYLIFGYTIYSPKKNSRSRKEILNCLNRNLFRRLLKGVYVTALTYESDRVRIMKEFEGLVIEELTEFSFIFLSEDYFKDFALIIERGKKK